MWLKKENASMGRLMAFLAKGAISALLLYISLSRVNLGSVGQRLGGLDLRWMALALFTLCVQMVLLALRWREIIVNCGAELPRQTAVRYTFIAQFFSQVLPSTVGGDAARVWLLGRDQTGWPAATYSVLIDRLVGASTLAILVITCLPWTFNMIHDSTARGTLVLIGFGALGGALVFLALGFQHLQMIDRWWLFRHLAVASRLTWRLFRSCAGARAALLSFAIHLITVMVAWGLAVATHAAVDLVQIMFLVLPVMLIATIPVSIAGWGLRESTMVLAFSYAGLLQSDGLIISVLFGLVNLAVGIIGSIIWVAGGHRWRSVKNIEAGSHAHELSTTDFKIG